MSTYLGVVSTILSFVFIFGSHVSVIVLAYVVRNHRANGTLESNIFKERYGTITEGISLNGFFGSYWNLLVLLRWTVTCYIMVYLRNIPAA